MLNSSESDCRFYNSLLFIIYKKIQNIFTMIHGDSVGLFWFVSWCMRCMFCVCKANSCNQLPTSYLSLTALQKQKDQTVVLQMVSHICESITTCIQASWHAETLQLLRGGLSAGVYLCQIYANIYQLQRKVWAVINCLLIY